MNVGVHVILAIIQLRRLPRLPQLYPLSWPRFKCASQCAPKEHCILPQTIFTQSYYFNFKNYCKVGEDHVIFSNIDQPSDETEPF